MKQFMHQIREKTRFKHEFRRQARMLIIFTLGFTIAFTWRETIFEISQRLVEAVTHIKSSNSLSIITSSFITVISLAVIYVSSHMLKDEFD